MRNVAWMREKWHKEAAVKDGVENKRKSLKRIESSSRTLENFKYICKTLNREAQEEELKVATWSR